MGIIEERTEQYSIWGSTALHLLPVATTKWLYKIPLDRRAAASKLIEVQKGN